MIHSVGKTGALVELQTAAMLMQAGFEVFVNAAPSGPADLVVWNPDTNETVLIDVKTINGHCASKHNPNNLTYWNTASIKPGVQLLHYAPNLNQYFWHPEQPVPECLKQLNITSTKPEPRCLDYGNK
jgi:hypothetical protein